MSRDLFGEVPPPAAAGKGETALRLVLHRTGKAAWLLSPDGDVRAARWIPMAEATRGEGRDENVWTMPLWLARDRGWA